jgi:methyltransferase family protein
MFGTTLRYFARHPILAVSAVAANPRESRTRLYDGYVDARERRRPGCQYEPVPDWEKHLHHFLGIPWPCAASSECSSRWPTIITLLSAKGIRAGPESYMYWNDGDPPLIRAIWCLIRQLGPHKVVETGVAHGVISRFILEELERNKAGRLWSIDLPQLKPVWRDHVGIAVGDCYPHRWSLIRGSSRRRLAPLLSQVGAIDLFVHDSLHSERNLRFELDRAWAALRPSGAIVVDDVDANWGFRSFLEAHPGHSSLICEAEPLRPDLRRFNDNGLFGIILKQRPARVARHAV